MKKITGCQIAIVLCVFSSLYSGNTERSAISDTPVKKSSIFPDMEVTPDVSAEELWKALCEYVPPGVTVTSLSLTPPIHWGYKQCGTYRYIPPIMDVQMKDGIILTTGYATNCLGPNTETGVTKIHGNMTTDPDLANAVNYTTMDPAVFEIIFTSDKTIPGFSFVFCFGTDEYDEFVNTQFNDVFICIYNGRNICFDSQGDLISVNNAFFNVDNRDGHLNLEYDGLTCVLQTSQVITPGSHSVKFAIADASDCKLDAGVFLNNFKFDTTITGTTPVINIIEDQQFVIPEQTPGGTTVGTITKLCKYGPVFLLTMNTVPEFYLNGWDIVVSNGVVFDASVQNQYVLNIRATLDTVWSGKAWIVHDTADMTINISGDNSWPQIDKAVIYDRNGNGVGDSICITLKYDFTEYSLSQADFSWPAGQVNYSESINNNNLYNKNTVAFSYAPGNSAPVWTHGRSAISVTIDSLGQPSTHSGDLQDGIGPVLIEASVVKRYKPMPDTFRVKISEPVNVSAISGKSFILIKKDPIKEIEIEPINGTVLDLGQESYIEFLVVDLLADAPAPGDSLKILHTGPVIDKKDNKAHEDNTPVPINFVGGNLDSWPQISNAVIYDQDGNGIGDSICITFNGSFIDSISTRTADFSWPQNPINYSENIDESNQYNNNTIAFSYAPGNNAPIWTQGQSTITVKLDSLQTEITRTAALNDGIGPLLTEASVIKRYVPDNDTFFVKITEPINVSDITGNSFTLINRAQGKSVDIEPLGSVVDLGSEAYIQFAITDLGADAPAQGDSLRILHTGSVIDKINNKAHKDNTPVPIRFIDSNVPVESACYYDINGDGIVDRVRAVFVDTVSTIDSITFDVTWTDINASANDVAATYESGDKKVVLLNLQNAFISSDVSDKTSGTMSLMLTYLTTGTSVTYAVTDKAAPVITKAVYYLSKFAAGKRGDTDSLTVTFSEDLNSISSDRPFLLKTQLDIRYYLVLQKSGQSADEASFTVNSIQGVSSPVEGDSIWINENENVPDNLGNPQAVEDNKRVELIIKTPPFELGPYVIGPKEPWNNYVPAELQVSGSSIRRGTIIVLEPDIFVPFNTLGAVACKVRIFDPVGNELASCNGYKDDNDLIAMSPLQNGPHNRIVILWAEKNMQNRDVGPGTYLGVINIEYPDQRKALKRVSIPIKE